jgi:hypothetical protein
MDLSHNKRIKNLNLAWCNIIENQDIALARENNFAVLYKKLKALKIKEAKKARPSNKPLTIAYV